VQGVSVVGSATDFEKFKNKPVCAIIKSRRTLEYWREKFSSFAIKNGKKYYLICSKDLEECDTKKINEIFETRNVKSSIFGLPKTEKSKTNPSMETPFSVSFKEKSGNYRNLHLDALGVYNYICSTHDNLASVSNIAQAKQNISEMTFDSLRKLNAFTVKKSNSNSGCTTTVVRGANMHKNEYAIQQQYANFFFFVTGFHGFHVFSGVLINIIIWLMAVKGVFEKRGHYEMIEKIGLYWHFVDLVWVFVFTFFYLI
jgi:hypothetical protein